MACNGCGTSMGLTKEQVENLINKLIDEGKLQAGLNDCAGNFLGKASRVLLCDTLGTAVNNLIKDGTIDVITDVAIEDGKLAVTDGTGKKTSVTIPGIKSVVIEDGKLVVTDTNGNVQKTAIPAVSDLEFDATTNLLSWKEAGEAKSAKLPYTRAAVGDEEVVFTLTDGSTVAVPKAGTSLEVDKLDHTIQYEANVPGHWGVKVKDKGGLDATDTGGLKVVTGNGIKLDENGKIAIDPSTAADSLAGDGLIQKDGKLAVATARLMDASGTVQLGYLVDTAQ